MLMKEPKQFLRLVGLCFVVLLNSWQSEAQELQQTEQVAGVKYQVINGLAEVMAINRHCTAAESALGYEEYEVQFRFLPMDEVALIPILENKVFSFQLHHRNLSLRVGPAYLDKMRLKTGTKYAMQLFQTDRLNVKPYFFRSKALELDLFEAYDAILNGLNLTLSLSKPDSNNLNKTYPLSEVQQRALTDAEVKSMVYNPQFNGIQLTEEAWQYLQAHEALLEEYEAAIFFVTQQLANQAVVSDSLLKKAVQQHSDSTNNKGWLQGKMTIVHGCYYESIPGTAHITGVNLVTQADSSAWGYDEYEIQFKFQPEEGYQLLPVFRDSNLLFALYHRGQRIAVGPEYIQQRTLKVGTTCSMTFFQKATAGSCSERYTYQSPLLDNDLSEVFPKRSKWMNLWKEQEEGTVKEKQIINQLDNNNQPVVDSSSRGGSIQLGAPKISNDTIILRGEFIESTVLPPNYFKNKKKALREKHRAALKALRKEQQDWKTEQESQKRMFKMLLEGNDR